jgi:hypothetical protein
MVDGSYRPIYCTFTEILGVYLGQRDLVDLQSPCAQASGNARWEREPVSEVPVSQEFQGMSASLSCGDQQKELLIESGGYGYRGLSPEFPPTDFQPSKPWITAFSSLLHPQSRPRARLKAANKPDTENPANRPLLRILVQNH